MIGLPSAAELACLERLREWEKGLEFEGKWGGEWPDLFAETSKMVESAQVPVNTKKDDQNCHEIVTKPIRQRRRPKWWPEATAAVKRAWLEG